MAHGARTGAAGGRAFEPKAEIAGRLQRAREHGGLGRLLLAGRLAGGGGARRARRVARPLLS
jgi:hypothetical protein